MTPYPKRSWPYNGVDEIRRAVNRVDHIHRQTVRLAEIAQRHLANLGGTAACGGVALGVIGHCGPCGAGCRTLAAQGRMGNGTGETDHIRGGDF
jgi:hypothetical protein